MGPQEDSCLLLRAAREGPWVKVRVWALVGVRGLLRNGDARAPLILRDSLAEGQSELGKPDIVWRSAGPGISPLPGGVQRKAINRGGFLNTWEVSLLVLKYWILKRLWKHRTGANMLFMWLIPWQQWSWLLNCLGLAEDCFVVVWHVLRLRSWVIVRPWLRTRGK